MVALRCRCFNPRPPHGGRQGSNEKWRLTPRGCFNPRPPHGGRLGRRNQLLVLGAVSIRAPRTGGDSRTLQARGLTPEDVSIRAPRTGGDLGRPGIAGLGLGAVSIRAPRTGGDEVRWVAAPTHGGFNPRPPHGGRHVRRVPPGRGAPFQSAPPARGATSARGRAERDR